MELLFEGLIELLGEVLLQFLFELLAEAIREAFGRESSSNKWFAAFGAILMGAVAGGISVLFLPHRLISTGARIPGLSLLIAPLVAGYGMSLVGKGLRAMGRNPSNLATFLGGSLFAFAMAAIRFCFFQFWR